MAEPISSATTLQDVLAVVQEQYDNRFDEQSFRHGRTINRLFMPDKRVASGDGITFQAEVSSSDTARFSSSPLSAIASPEAFAPAKLKIRWNETGSANDFSRLSASAQVSYYELINGSAGTVVDVAERVHRQLMQDADEKSALMRHRPKNGAIATVSGTPTENDSWKIASATSTPDTTDGIRFTISEGSLAAFQPGTRVAITDTSSSAAVIAANIRVDSKGPNLDDGSVGFVYDATGTPNPSSEAGAGVAGVASGDIVYLANRNGTIATGVNSLGSWFTPPAASGDSFIGGADRAAVANRWLMTTNLREGSTARKISKSDFDSAAIAAGYVEDDQKGVVAFANLELVQAIRNEVGEDAFISFPIDDSRAKRFMNFGTMGLNYQHPSFGVVKIIGDPLAPKNTVRMCRMGDWTSVSWGHREFRIISGGDQGGGWYRTQETTTSGENYGKGLIYKVDGIVPGMCDYCRVPKRQVQIMNVTA